MADPVHAPDPNPRSYGIHLLRIVSMFYVVMLHFIGRGGLSKSVSMGTAQYTVSWVLQIWTFCAVDIFALISGFVGYRDDPRQVKLSRYLSLWSEVVVYCLALTAVFRLLRPDLGIVFRDFLQMLFPVTGKLYWYFTAYTGLFLLMPFLDRLMSALSRRSARKLFFLIVLAFSAYAVVTSHRFNLANGYNVFWLTLLYLLGSCIKKCGIGRKLSPLGCVAGVILLVAVTYLWKIFGSKHSKFGVVITPDTLISYISPTILGCAVLHVILFDKLSFRGSAPKIIAFDASGSFAVYILNNQKWVWNSSLIENSFVPYANASPVLLAGALFGCSLCFLGGSVLIDWCRRMLFKAVKIDSLFQKIDTAVLKGIDRIPGD